MANKRLGTSAFATAVEAIAPVSDWDKVIFLYIGRGKDAKTTNARIHIECLLRAGRLVTGCDLEPINAGLASCFPPGVIVKPNYSIETASQLAEFFYAIAKTLSVDGGVAVIDTPGNFKAIIDLAEVTDVTRTIRIYGVRLVFVVCCGAESDDLAMLDALVAVSSSPPDYVILAVAMKGLPARFRDPRVLTQHFASRQSVHTLMRDNSEVVLVPECDALEKLDGRCVEVHRAASAPPLDGLEPYQGAMIGYFLQRFKKLFSQVMPCD